MQFLHTVMTNLLKFLVGLAWNVAVLWFAASRLHAKDALDVGVIITSVAFGWMLFAQYRSPEASMAFALATFIMVSFAIGVCTLVVATAWEQGILITLLGVVLFVTVPSLLVGLGWLMWLPIRKIKQRRQ